MDNIDIKIENLKDVTVVEITGDIDANTAPTVQEEVIPQAKPGSKILLDMNNVKYASSAGLRFLLSLHRQVKANDGKLVLVGLAEEIRDTMEVTGFLDFFTRRDTPDEALKALSTDTPDAGVKAPTTDTPST